MSFQEIKCEPLGEEVEGIHDESNNDMIRRAEDVSQLLDVSGICFGYEDKIKEEIKQEIKPEPLDENNIDAEAHSCEDDQEKRYLQAMVDKLLIKKQTLQIDMNKYAGLQEENQILKSEKNNVEKQLRV